jgi:hypothetical protein
VCDIAVHSVSTSPGDCVFVDSEGLNARKTSSTQTLRCSDFTHGVINRDGNACVITQMAEEDCDVAHLIPRAKGDGVRFLVSSYNYLMTLLSSTLQK